MEGLHEKAETIQDGHLLGNKAGQVFLQPTLDTSHNRVLGHMITQ